MDITIIEILSRSEQGVTRPFISGEMFEKI